MTNAVEETTTVGPCDECGKTRVLHECVVCHSHFCHDCIDTVDDKCKACQIEDEH